MKRQIIHLPRFTSARAHVISHIKPKWMNHPAIRGKIRIVPFDAIPLRRILRENVEERPPPSSRHLERTLGAESPLSTAAINVGCSHSFLAAPPSASSSDATFSLSDKRCTQRSQRGPVPQALLGLDHGSWHNPIRRSRGARSGQNSLGSCIYGVG